MQNVKCNGMRCLVLSWKRGADGFEHENVILSNIVIYVYSRIKCQSSFPFAGTT